ncbi:MAG: hypothetical protein JST02_10765 [Bacteroidetes bacterium]|nr:hypothetical protein [Bacteroidota bacterium]
MYLSACKKILSVSVFCLVFHKADAQLVEPPYQSNILDFLNTIKSWTVTAPLDQETDVLSAGITDAKLVTQYYDGLGRPLQTVSRQTSPQGKDMVSTVVYDNLGRQSIQHLPYVSPGNDGSFKLNAFSEQSGFYDGLLNNTFGNTNQGETYFYGQTVFENSPLNRPVKTMAPGNSWIGAEKGVEVHYYSNSTVDGVRYWQIIQSATSANPSYTSESTYEPNSLFKTIISNEHQNQIIEFKNKSGQVVLKKVQVGEAIDDGTGVNHEGWMCTYYVYDDIGNLRLVIPPKVVEAIRESDWLLTPDMIEELCFTYEYDNHNRMIIKHVPGAGEVWMVYDSRDRLVLIQDANLRAQDKWLYTLYNAVNRPIETGLWNNNQNRDAHASLAEAATNYPDLFGQTYEVHTRTYYDNYDWVGTNNTPSFGTSPEPEPMNVFEPTGSAPYPQPPLQQSTAVKGMVTGSSIAILDGSQKYLHTVSYYDDKGRIIQTKATNITGGTDVSSTQYSFVGQPLVNIIHHNYVRTTTPLAVSIATRMHYDDMGRLLAVQKKTDETEDWKIISEMQYNELGQVKEKKYGTNPQDPTLPLTTNYYEYNIRGWLLSVNKLMLSGSKMYEDRSHFAFQLAYDNTTGVKGGTYSNPQYNGNIAGVTWAQKGDMVRRKYEFSYDKANRIMRADFTQNRNTNLWDADIMDFSIKMGDGDDYRTAYDFNGNIKKMQQWAYKIGGIAQIDDLDYSYLNDGISNKLASVTDNTGYITNNTLGDFNDGNTGSNDYAYDVNGNMVTDNNKSISNIQYNHLNLPQNITVDGKGSIEYIYDATGNKLRKIVHETNQPDKTTTYVGGFVYENDELQFISNEEGRMRYKPQASGDNFQYDYFLKDHLGNVREVITEEQKQDIYPAATLEGTGAATDPLVVEKQYYQIDEAQIFDAATNHYPVTTDYENNNGILNNNPNCTANTPIKPTDLTQKLYRLDGAGGVKTGLGITLKVMAGDKLDIFGKSFYINSAAINSYSSIPVADLLAGFLTTPGAASVISSHGVVTPSQIGTTETNTNINNFLSSQENNNSAPTVPKAYINYIFFDEQFKYAGSGCSRVGNSNEVTDHYTVNNLLHDIEVPKNGFVYIYCSNISPVMVLFDNIQVVHTRGAILEESSYYPFGLIQHALCSKASEILVNNFKYNSKEVQRQEFSDGTGLDWLDFGARLYDGQIGRFFTQDRFASKYQGLNPYAYGANNPINFNDVNGDSLWIAFGEDNQNRVLYQDGKLLNPDGSQYTGPGVKVKKNGKIKITNSFLKSAVGALDKISSTTTGGEGVNQLEGSKNNFIVAQGSWSHFDPGNFDKSNAYRNNAEGVRILDEGKKVIEGYEFNQIGSGGIIYFDPDNPAILNGTSYDPIIVFAHEMGHALDADKGWTDSRSIQVNGVCCEQRTEVRATYFQNMVSQQLGPGYPLRQYYSGTATPPMPPSLLNSSGNPINISPPSITWLPLLYR